MPVEIGWENNGVKTYWYRGGYMKTLLLLALVGIVLFMLFGHTNRGFWNLNIPYPAGVTTNAAAIMPGQTGRPWNGSGLPMGQYVGQDWTAQPFGGVN